MAISPQQKAAEDTIRTMHPLGRLLAQLRAEFPPELLRTRKGPGGRDLTYVDARVVEDRLDDVAGPQNWQDHYEAIGPLAEHALQCYLTVHGVTKAGIGYPTGRDDEDDELKNAESDALKRAGVKFGIGRYLYRINKGQDAGNQPRPRPQAPAAPNGAPSTADEPSEKQLAFLRRLCGRMNVHVNLHQPTEITKHQLSDLMDELQAGDITNPRITRTTVNPQDDLNSPDPWDQPGR